MTVKVWTVTRQESTYLLREKWSHQGEATADENVGETQESKREFTLSR